MGEESPKPASTPPGALFLSCASQDAEAARWICAALRASRIEVWPARDTDLYTFAFGDPLLAPLHTDARWSVLMRKMNLPE
jgi:hypothetical protein